MISALTGAADREDPSSPGDRPSPASAESIRTRKFDRIKQWLQEDWQKWETSPEAFSHGQQFPPRLLDLGADEGRLESGPPKDGLDWYIRLIDTRDARKVRIPGGMVWCPYAILSHRWGPSTELSRTLQENLEARCSQGVKASELCKTFQDAIVAALEMGMPYLWIDSLCIVQDDVEDWRHQSSFMDDIYMNAIVTITAHSYGGQTPDDDGGGGFLDNALTAEGDEPSLLGTTDTGSAGEGGGVLYARRDRMFEVDIFNSPLSQRGWILQERLLSPRIVHFFPSQIFYEGRLFGIVRAEDRTPAFRDPDKLREVVFRPENQAGATPLDWFRVVERYSACRLTQDADKLVAISGIAKHFQQRSGVRYLAGLWADRAAKGLLWLARGPSLARRPGRAPSWSWASVDGPIRYPSQLLDRPFRVLPTLEVVASVGNALDRPRHILGEPENTRSLHVRAFVRRATLSPDWLDRRDGLLPYYPLGWKGETLRDLDAEGVYREVHDEAGRVVGWASLDEDAGGREGAAGPFYTAIVASEEAWFHEDDPDDVVYRTHPPTPQYDALYATGRVAATFASPTFRTPPSNEPSLPVEHRRELAMTYWVVVLRPDDGAEAESPGAKFSRAGFGQVFDRRWQRPEDRRMVHLI